MYALGSFPPQKKTFVVNILLFIQSFTPAHNYTAFVRLQVESACL